MAGGRDLQFEGLGGVMPEVERLLAGYRAVGNWSLAQILRHLATSIRLTARAFGQAGEPPEFSPRWEARRRKFFEAGRSPEGMEVPFAFLIPPPGLDERVEAEGLAGAIAELLESPDPPPFHPILGPLSREDWSRFHAMHCAHHLAFALPTSTGGS